MCGRSLDVITYSAAILVRKKGGQWEKALSLDTLLLLKKMRKLPIQPNEITYSAAIQACASTGQPIVPLKMFDEAQQNLKVDLATYNSILGVVCTSHPIEALRLYHCSFSLYGAVQSTENGVPMLDLHNHSKGAGEMVA